MIILSLILSLQAFADDEPKFAHVCAGEVKQVIVATQEEVNKPHRAKPGCKWVPTATDGSKGKNYAGLGYSYNEGLNAFIVPKPYPSWVLNEGSASWMPTTPRPQDEANFKWDEESKSWKGKDKIK